MSKFATILAISVLILLPGCTITPQILKSPTATFSRSERNSGVVGKLDGYYILDAYGKAKADSLVKLQSQIRKFDSNFGFTPPLHRAFWTGKIDGMESFTNGTFRATNDTMFKLQMLNLWRKEAGL